ncbi:hypothetical protein ASPBRDRAFT_40183 [Aspergillus brasiliensis CBS 101740]|uniref:Uncharacterized protein n=1 Tax=Aspergillus brasiliensis (strain CBS 101740 / IMI 381727 / IBT 21946) TaxID=767769 RepID=A0A1L9UTL0_ASPBC|nr:hypothetical protein ASPBRDRAFT_40183 [Aspergillus brasiliensis CBS 101740]
MQAAKVRGLFRARFLPSRYSPVRSWWLRDLQKSNDSSVCHQASFPAKTRIARDEIIDSSHGTIESD